MASRAVALSVSLLALAPGLLAAPAPAGVARAVPSAPPGTPAGLRGDTDLQGPNGAPLDSPVPPIDYELVPGQKADKDLGFYLDFTKTENPQPFRGSHGATDPGPRQIKYDSINSDLFAPPGTDSGDVPNAKWPMGLSHNRAGLDNSGWARQQNVGLLPVATAMAGVDMRLAPHAYRELHWHKASEWALIFSGSVRVSAINEDGKTFTDDLNEGDVWFFPAGVPHSIQAFENGTEFLLVFDDGEFSEDETFLATEALLRNPQVVMAKTLEASVDELAGAPDDELYIFPGTPQDHDIATQTVDSPAGALRGDESYTFHWSEQKPYEVPGGSVKILDPETFPIASQFSAALVTIQPGAMREYHWHLTSDEWSFFVSGSAARVTIYDAPEASRTFDFSAGDVAYIPVPQSHYIENVGDDDIVLLEVLQADKFADISFSQWIALTPKQVFKDTLNFSDDLIDRQPKEKTFIKPGSTNLTETDFRPRGAAADTAGTATIKAPAASASADAPAPA